MTGTERSGARSATALVVDDDAGARHRIAGLLRLAGWQVHEAADAEGALRRAAALDLDLVVTDAWLPDGNGPAMLRRLRSRGSRARFVVVTADPSQTVRAEAAGAGALATLATPVEARILLDFLQRRAGVPADPGSRPATAHDDGVDPELMARLQRMYAAALPGRLSAIAAGTRSGDTVAVASAAHALAGASGQLGHPEVADACLAIAADARRGLLAHASVVRLRALASRQAATRR